MTHSRVQMFSSMGCCCDVECCPFRANIVLGCFSQGGCPGLRSGCAFGASLFLAKKIKKNSGSFRHSKPVPISMTWRFGGQKELCEVLRPATVTGEPERRVGYGVL